MKSRVAFLAVVLLALLACKKKRPDPTIVPAATAATATATATAPADTWVTFKDDKGAFEVRSPSALKEETMPNATAAGSLETHMFVASAGSVVYQLAYTDMPAAIVKAGGPKKLLKGGEEGALKAVNATATTSKEVTVGGFPGREFTTTAEAEGIKLDYTGRVIMAKNRLYQIQVLGPVGTVLEADRRKFIDSFKLNK